MAAFDTALAPVSATPANTSDATLFTASADSSVLIDVANIGTAAILVRVGVTPSGGSNAWRIHDLIIESGNPLLRYGPVFLQNGDAVVVRTNTANVAVFSLDGVETS